MIEEFNLFSLDAVTRPWQVAHYSDVAQTLSSMLTPAKTTGFSGTPPGITARCFNAGFSARPVAFPGGNMAARPRICYRTGPGIGQQRLKYPLTIVIFEANTTT